VLNFQTLRTVVKLCSAVLASKIIPVKQINSIEAQSFALGKDFIVKKSDDYRKLIYIASIAIGYAFVVFKHFVGFVRLVPFDNGFRNLFVQEDDGFLPPNNIDWLVIFV
jgi:hypothetical protein